MRGREKIYKVVFTNEGEVWEVYCQQVSQSGLFAFIELGGFLFGERTVVVVDPAEEKLKRVFDGVERTHVPMHAIIRIDEVVKRGTATIHVARMDKGAKVLTLPSSLHTPTKRK